MHRTIISATVLGLFASVASADVIVTFDEGAPKDRFTFENTSTCLTGPLTVAIDLSGSAANLVFDVTGEGAGVEVFQPFDLVKGSAQVVDMPMVKDGDTGLSISLTALATPVAFTIDVDDTIGQREITVSRSEIEGASASVSFGGSLYEANFTTQANAVIETPDCQG